MGKLQDNVPKATSFSALISTAMAMICPASHSRGSVLAELKMLTAPLIGKAGGASMGTPEAP